MTDPKPANYFTEAEAALDLASTYRRDGAPESAARCLAEAQVYATLANAQAVSGQLLVWELTALRRIVAEHVHLAQSHPAGPVRKTLTEQLVTPLLAALDDAAISLTPELMEAAGGADDSPRGTICRDCNGSGTANGAEIPVECTTCWGQGAVRAEEPGAKDE